MNTLPVGLARGKGDNQYIYTWQTLPGSFTMVHQENEARADLADALREAGLAIISPIERFAVHGTQALLVLKFKAVPFDYEQRKILSNKKETS